MSDCCEKNNGQTREKKGFFSGLLYGLIPHAGCLLFLIFTVFGITAFSAILKPLLISRYFFYLLILFSLVLTTLSAMIYLKKKSSLSPRGIRSRWKYLFTLYGTTLGVNLLLFLVVFPYAANLNFNSIFEEKPGGTLTPRQRIRVGGVELSPGVVFRGGVAFGGIDFTQFIGRDLEVETDGPVLVIKGIY